MRRRKRADRLDDHQARGGLGRRQLIVASLAASALLVACSAEATIGVPTTMQNSGAAKQSTLTRARLRSALLKRSDLPAGWRRKPKDSQDSSVPRGLQRHLARCLGVHSAVMHQLSGVASPNFVADRTQISSSVDSYRRHAQVAGDVKLMRNRKAPHCMSEVFRAYLPKVLPAQADVSNVVVHLARRAGGMPRDVVGVLNVSFDIATPNGPVGMHLAETMIAKGTVEAEVTTVVIGASLDRAMQRRLGRLVGHRVERL